MASEIWRERKREWRWRLWILAVEALPLGFSLVFQFSTMKFKSFT
jgi:hypothetical protein